MAKYDLALSANSRNGLKYLNDRDAQTFLRKLRQQKSDQTQLAHTEMELIPGVYGARMGFTPQYEPKLEGQTPDWLFLGRDAGPCFFGEVVNFHNSDQIEAKIESDSSTQGWWAGDVPCSVERLSPSLMSKAGKYKDLADKIDLPLVIFAYGWFNAFLHPVEVEFCLRDSEYGLFKSYPQLSGVYHFDDATPVGRRYMEPGFRFRYYANPTATRDLDLADGLVPLPIPNPSV